MKTFISDLLNGNGSNYILPFFWQHGETEDVLREYMGVIHGCGIGAVCVEARPHPDFAGPGWWHDMDIILDEARKRNMKVWILDDAHFPTGYANGKMLEKDDSLCKQYLAYNCADVYGPVPEATLNVEGLAHYRPTIREFANPIFAEKNPRKFNDDELFAVVAAKVLEGDTVSKETVVLTDKVRDGWLSWDVPEGVWRIFVVYKTRNGGGKTSYINMLDPDSCHVQIEAVYEPHYEHYKEDFGKTIAGFFSDEPAVGNTIGFDFDESIGRKKMHLPWNKDMDGMLKERLGGDYAKFLPALWTDMDDTAVAGRVRYSYMDSATALISESFSGQIGAWCRAHGVEYIGHIVEDLNQHSRFGSSMGHFFRAMKGQHMSGIDDIGNQVLVGGEDNRRLDGFAKGGQGEFFHFELGKLGSSFAHIDPKKQGRAMCEIFGAYGWNTGVRTMKYLTDHFLVRGINTFVPHAFSPKAFPDPDCPPHFYAHGENPQYRHFGKLMHYMNRMCHIFNHGKPVIPVALLYHGEAEWSGGYMLDQKPARQLLEHQIDFDIVPSDVFAHMDEFDASFGGAAENEVPAGGAFGNVLKINGQTYKAFIVPYAQYITKAVAQFCASAVLRGFKVFFVDSLPQGFCDMENDGESQELLDALKSCTVIPLYELGSYLQETDIPEVRIVPAFRRLRYYHYVQDNAHIYMISNEDPSKAFVGDVFVAARGNMYGYDAMDNRLYSIDGETTENGTCLHLRLGAYESAVVVFDESGAPEDTMQSGKIQNMSAADNLLENGITVTGSWKISTCEAKQYPDFKFLAQLDRLHDIGRLARDFSGFIRYETEFEDKGTFLIIENAYEGVEVWVNDVNVGMAICPPYRFDISGTLKEGKNSLRIEVATTLYRKVASMEDGQNPFSNPPAVMEPLGIVGEVKLCHYSQSAANTCCLQRKNMIQV
ncbi:MAG: glycoside hydrolase family 2 [Clostridiales bacterium]|nr:glycoside hydrolase family 2 [Clostridiales bacterium]